MKRSAALISLIAAVAFVAAAEVPSTGSVAPSFELAAANGRTVALADFRGTWLVLYFYPRDFTSGCTIQAAAFQRDLAAFREVNAEVVGISVDSVESHQRFCEQQSIGFQLLSDPDAHVSLAYGSTMTYDGQIMSARNTFLIDPDGRIAHVFLSVEPIGHSADVLRTVRQLIGSRP